MTELDEIPVSTLANRYSIHRSQVYTRLDALKQRDSNLVPVKHGKRAYITGYMLECLDGMAALIQNGSTTQEAADKVLGSLPPVVSRPVDTRHVNESGLAVTEPELAPEDSFDFSNLLEMLRGLQELADKNWWLSTSQLAQVMGLKSLPPGDHFERYGFRFTRSGKNGLETAWKVEKL